MALAILLATASPTKPTATTTAPAGAPPAEVNDLAQAQQYYQDAPKRWYGWQILIADGAAATLYITAAYAGAGDALGFLGVGSLFTGPIVHWAHGNVGRGFGSFGLRIGTPIAGFFTGWIVGVALTGDSLGGAYLGLLGILLGASAALVIDVGALAWEEDPDWYPQQHRQAFSFVPTVFRTADNEATLYGLAGTF